jgi:hypothetical protein
VWCSIERIETASILSEVVEIPRGRASLSSKAWAKLDWFFCVVRKVEVQKLRENLMFVVRARSGSIDHRAVYFADAVKKVLFRFESLLVRRSCRTKELGTNVQILGSFGSTNN